MKLKVLIAIFNTVLLTIFFTVLSFSFFTTGTEFIGSFFKNYWIFILLNVFSKFFIKPPRHRIYSYDPFRQVGTL